MMEATPAMITLEDNSTASVWEFMNRSLDDRSDRTRPEQIVLTIVFILYTIIGILGNALVLVSIIRIRHWSGLERAMMCFLTNLAISDFLLCLITFPATAISAIHNTWVLGINMCWIVGFATSYLRIVSILFMMWIGVHRAFVIKYPFSKKITRRIARVISVCVWIFATVPQLTCYIGISPMHYDKNRAVCIASLLGDHMVPVMIYTLVYLVIPMGTIIGVYSLLLYIAIGAVRRTKDLTELQNSDETPRRGLSVAHRRAFGTVFAQIGGFLLCFLPFVIFVGLSKIDKDIIPTRVQVYGACSSSMSAIINPIIYMNTNKTFKKFVINLLKCRNMPTNPTSTAVASQFQERRSSNFGRLSVSTGSGVNYNTALRDLYKNTGLTKQNSVPSSVNGKASSRDSQNAPYHRIPATFRNPSAVVETRVVRNSTVCPVGYNQDGPRFVQTRNNLAVEGTRGYRRSKSEVATPNTNLLSPHVKVPLPRKQENKRITFHGFLEPECPETNQKELSNSSSSSDDGGRTEKVVQTTTLSADISDPLQSTQHSECSVGLRGNCSAERSCSPSDNSRVSSDSPSSKPRTDNSRVSSDSPSSKPRTIETRVSSDSPSSKPRTIETRVSSDSPSSKPRTIETRFSSDSPSSKPRTIETENQLTVSKPEREHEKGALFLSEDETVSDNSSGSELDFIGNDSVRPLSPVENPDVSESEKFEQGDRKSLMENQITHSKENELSISEKELEEKNSSLDCSPRISLNVNRLLSLKVKQ